MNTYLIYENISNVYEIKAESEAQAEELFLWDRKKAKFLFISDNSSIDVYEEQSDELLFNENDFAQFRWLNRKEKKLFTCDSVDCLNKAVKEYSFDDSTFYYCKEH